jgi:hypothetical protein
VVVKPKGTELKACLHSAACEEARDEIENGHTDDRDHLFQSIATSVARVLTAPLDDGGDGAIMLGAIVLNKVIPLDRRWLGDAELKDIYQFLFTGGFGGALGFAGKRFLK